MACIHRSAHAGTCRTRFRTLTSRAGFSPRVARLCGQRPSLRRLRRRRPSRSPKVVSAVVVLLEATGRELVQDFNIRATGPRSGETLRPGTVGPIVSGTLVLQRCPAHRVTGAGAGVEPWFVAFFLAIRRRAWTTSAGTRAAIRRAAPGALAPLKIGGSRRGLLPVARRRAHASAVNRSATAATRGA